jgi:copper(I)-binding protein
VLKKASLLVVPLVLMSACSAGRHNPQFKEGTAEDGVSAVVGGNAVRDAYIATTAAKGGSTLASVYVARLVPGSDTLVSATSPVAGGIEIMSGGTEVASVPVTADGPGTVALNLTDLTRPIDTASYYPITLTFATAGEVTLQVPVLRPGIVAPGSTTLPTVVPDVPNGSTVPLQDRSVVPNTPQD